MLAIIHNFSVSIKTILYNTLLPCRIYRVTSVGAKQNVSKLKDLVSNVEIRSLLKFLSSCIYSNKKNFNNVLHQI